MTALSVLLIVGSWVMFTLILVMDALRPPKPTDRVRCLCCDERVLPRDINPGNGMCSACNASTFRTVRHKHINHGDLF